MEEDERAALQAAVDEEYEWVAGRARPILKPLMWLAIVLGLGLLLVTQYRSDLDGLGLDLFVTGTVVWAIVFLVVLVWALWALVRGLIRDHYWWF